MLKVLVIDDETVVRRGIVLGVDWAAMGCVVVGEAANGQEGLLAVERYSPNLIITDVRMPKMDGIEMLQELRRRRCRAHVILLTAYSDFEYVRSALQMGADDYLLKPFEDTIRISIQRAEPGGGAAAVQRVTRAAMCSRPWNISPGTLPRAE